MDHHKAYERLYERAIDRELDEYTEVHHIVPRCIGGDNSKSNLVRLTPEEHFVAHQLLSGGVTLESAQHPTGAQHAYRQPL